MPSMPKFPAVLAVCTLVSFISHAQSPAAAIASPTAPVQTADNVQPLPPTAPARALDYPESVSQVRIVRLSEIRGTAQLDRNAGRGFEPAFANIPIIRGSKLRTDAGLAEVEFEDNSTLRLAPDTAVEFAVLGRGADGQTITACKVLKGMVYVTLGSRPGAFTVTAGGSTLSPSPKSHLRLDLGDAATTIAVMDGSVDVSGAFGSTTIPKKRTLTLAAGEQPTLEAATRVAQSPYDEWDKQGNAYQSRYSNAAFGGSGMGFGSSDLNYYGGFADLPGCGSMWRPYFANAAWDPYGAGTWASYPGAGYSFVSPYPWGWLPFHSGSWQQCGAAGWGWNPAGSWSGLNNSAVLSKAGKIVHAPLKPPIGNASLVGVRNGPVETSGPTSESTFTFRQNSAGLGVPRQVFGSLGHSAHTVDRHGFANTEGEVGFVAVPRNERPGSAGSGSLASPRTIPVITRASASSSFASLYGTTAPSTSGSARTTSGAATASSMHSGASVGGSSAGGNAGSTGGGGGHK